MFQEIALFLLDCLALRKSLSESLVPTPSVSLSLSQTNSPLLSLSLSSLFQYEPLCEVTKTNCLEKNL